MTSATDHDARRLGEEGPEAARTRIVALLVAARETPTIDHEARRLGEEGPEAARTRSAALLEAARVKPAISDAHVVTSQL